MIIKIYHKLRNECSFPVSRCTNISVSRLEMAASNKIPSIRLTILHVKKSFCSFTRSRGKWLEQLPRWEVEITGEGGRGLFSPFTISFCRFDSSCSSCFNIIYRDTVPIQFIYTTNILIQHCIRSNKSKIKIENFSISVSIKKK